ncbi:MAG: preprotein translocase subunit YajC, partial [Longimicrobiales bacterium]
TKTGTTNSKGIYMPVLFTMLLQQAPASTRVLPQFIMIGVFIAIFWFLLIRPQRKMRQQHDALVTGLKKGDEIMTDGGIIGQIVHVADDRLTIRTAENTRIVVARAKIARVMTAETSEPKGSS